MVVQPVIKVVKVPHSVGLPDCTLVYRITRLSEYFGIDKYCERIISNHSPVSGKIIGGGVCVRRGRLGMSYF